MKRLIPLLILTACAPAHAQVPQCAPHESVVSGLAAGYGERRVMVAVISEEQTFEVYANEITGTWTAITVQADGLACLRTSGTDFDSTVATLPAEL